MNPLIIYKKTNITFFKKIISNKVHLTSLQEMNTILLYFLSNLFLKKYKV